MPNSPDVSPSNSIKYLFTYSFLLRPKTPYISPLNSINSLFKSSFNLRPSLHKFNHQILYNTCSHHPPIYAQVSTPFANKYYKIPIQNIYTSTKKSPKFSLSNSIKSLFKSYFLLRPSPHILRLKFCIIPVQIILSSTPKSPNFLR